MSAVAHRNGVYRVENGALVFVRPFVDPADKCHDHSASAVAPRARTNVMTFGERAPDKFHENSATPVGAGARINFMKFREAS